MENLLSKIEAVLFAYGEPISIERLGKILKINPAELESALKDMETELSRQERGIVLIKNVGKIQLATKPELTGLLEGIIKQEFTEDLTPAALETLSIIAYAGPISRADIEYIRGVNSSFTMRNLLLRGLAERTIDPKRANAYIYTASFDLIKRLGILKVEDLPDYEKYKQMVKNLHEASLNPAQQKADILIPEEQARSEDLQSPINPAKENGQNEQQN